ncbi:MAG: 16S rRNA (adenine(1518)-N(6)/adenine(1519)-N(6))-dimethyltransferase RsmA [Christensenellales bacterium]
MEITSPSQLAKLLKEYALVPLKQLGQNFLVDRNIVNNIVRFAGIDENDDCLEIGPGAGALSCAICEKAKKLVAVEIDRGMTELLRHVLAPYNNATVIHADALKYDLSNIFTDQACQKIKVVANLPYYITSPLIFKLFEIGDRISSMTLMVQKEVAQRIAAKPGGSDYGALSVLVQNRCNIVFGFKVPPDCFFPKPNVDSTVIRLEVFDKPRCGVDHALFEKTVLMAFTQKRKTILNNLSAQTGQTKEALSPAILAAGLSPTQRAEQLSIEQFAQLAKAMDSLSSVQSGR